MYIYIYLERNFKIKIWCGNDEEINFFIISTSNFVAIATKLIKKIKFILSINAYVYIPTLCHQHVMFVLPRALPLALEARARTHIHTHTHTHTHTHKHTLWYRNTHPHPPTPPHINTHLDTYTHTHTCTYLEMHCTGRELHPVLGDKAKNLVKGADSPAPEAPPRYLLQR